MARTPPPLDAATILDCLNRHGVLYVIIGAFAVEAQGARLPKPTSDVDVTPGTDGANLQRLSIALDELGAMLRVGDEEPIPFDHDAKSLAGFPFFNLTCAAGDFDLAFEPAAFETQGYERLLERSTTMEIGGVHAPVAHLMDVIASKLKADRPKDRLALPVLVRFAESQGFDTSQIRLEPLASPTIPLPEQPNRPRSRDEARRRLEEMDRERRPRGPSISRSSVTTSTGSCREAWFRLGFQPAGARVARSAGWSAGFQAPHNPC